MSKILFTDAQVKKLSKNKWSKNITNKGITYSDEFNYKLVKECENYKKFPQDIFRECSIDPEIVGITRIQNCSYRWRKQINTIGETIDTRTTKSGNTIKRELSDKEKLERTEAKIKLLVTENELLKKRIDRNNKDQKDFDLILKAYKFKKRKNGARQIMMVLNNEFLVHFNLKKRRRLMKKFGLKCPIRQANPYRRMMKATQEHTTCENMTLDISLETLKNYIVREM